MQDVTYTFEYDDLGRKTTVKVGTQTLSTNVYASDRSGLLKEVRYGNGGKVKYAHDEFDRLTGVRYDSETTDRYAYEYGANGAASMVTDNHLNRTMETEYDLAERPMQSTLRDSAGNLLYRATLKYDVQNQLERFREQAGDEAYETSFAYDKDGRPTQVKYGADTRKVDYGYDTLGRISSRTVTNGTNAYGTTYTFVAGGYGANSTTPLVAKITQPQISFEYTYDNRGNILSEKRGTLTTSYAYDALGQLVRVNDPNDPASGNAGTTWVYEYDRGGNMLNKKRYAYTIGTPGTVLDSVSYSYTDSNWKDKLTAYDGQAITYDAIGNPLSDGTWTYQWQAGRQLKQMSKSGMTVQFAYDHNGLRTQKKVTANGVTTTTNYMLHGKQIMHLTRGTDSMHFYYDAQSRPAMVEFNGTMYTYVHNLQGDISSIVDNLGSIVVEYGYDAWGKKLSTTGTLATTLGALNPFRYRGYVYDEETGLYYLRSRYYSSLRVRFLNTDSTLHHIYCPNGCNLYLYCGNLPVTMHDTDGKDAVWILDDSQFTHASLLIQDENDVWHYYYWGAATDGSSSSGGSNMGSNVSGSSSGSSNSSNGSSSSAASNPNGNLIYVEVGIEISADLTNDAIIARINGASEVTDYTGSYDKAIYLVGDHTASHKKAMNQVENGPEKKYNVFSNNCAHAVIDLLMETYKSGSIFKALTKMKKKWVPSNMHDILEKAIQ